MVVHQYTRHVIGSRYSVKKRSSVKTLNCAKDTQIQLERALGKAHDYPHDPRKRSDRELYLPHHPVVNPNKPGNVRRVPYGTFKIHGTILNKSLLVGPDLLKNSFFFHFCGSVNTSKPSAQTKTVLFFR